MDGVPVSAQRHLFAVWVMGFARQGGRFSSYQNKEMQKSYGTPWTHSQIFEPQNSAGILRLQEKRYALEYVCKRKSSHLLCLGLAEPSLFLSVRQQVAFRGSWDVLNLWTISRALAGFFSRRGLGTWRSVTRRLPLLHPRVTLGTPVLSRTAVAPQMPSECSFPESHWRHEHPRSLSMRRNGV